MFTRGSVLLNVTLGWTAAGSVVPSVSRSCFPKEWRRPLPTHFFFFLLNLPPFKQRDFYNGGLEK